MWSDDLRFTHISTIANEIKNADKAECAFYDLNSKEIKKALAEKHARLIIDRDNIADAQEIMQVKYDNSNAIMHNKFCIL